VIAVLFMGTVLPALIAGALILVAGFLPVLLGSPIRRLSFPVAFLVGFYLLNSVPAWPPTGSVAALFYLVIICFFWSFIEGARGHHTPWLRFFLFGVGVFMLLKPLLLDDRLGVNLPYLHGRLEMAVHVLSLILFGHVLWWLTEKGEQRSPAPTLLVSLIMTATGLSLLMLFSGSALMAQLAGAYCAVHAALLVLSLLGSRFHYFADHKSFSVVTLFAFVLLALYFLEAPLKAIGLVLTPLLLPAFWSWLPVKPVSALGQAAYVVAISLLPLVFAVYPVYQAY
jgi:hypothetical protein